MPIKVPKEVFEGLEAVRESGAVNMLSRMDVVVAVYQQDGALALPYRYPSNLCAIVL